MFCCMLNLHTTSSTRPAELVGRIDRSYYEVPFSLVDSDIFLESESYHTVKRAAE